MRKLLFPAFVLMTLNVFGQATPPATPATRPPNPYAEMDNRPDFIAAVQMGTDTLANGDTVKLTEETLSEMKMAMASPNYIVMLTPRGDCGQLNLVKTNPNYFIVKQHGSTSPDGIFDYVVYAKQKRPMMPMRRPPMHQPVPGQGQQPAPPTPPQQH